MLAAVHHLKRLIGLAVKPADNKRSAHWPAVRAAWLRDHPTCAACGGKDDLEVHHKIPFHLHPTMELDPTNFVTLCERAGRACHFRYGHFFDWSDYNPAVAVHAADELKRITGHHAPP